MGKILIMGAAVVGAVAITYFTGGAGLPAYMSAISAGIAVGGIAASILDPATTTTTNIGQRLGDVGITSSAYGVTIPWGRGSVRLGGNMIWAAPLREQANTTSTSSGGKGGLMGGGAVTKTTTYVYHASFALGLCEGPVDRVTRIWADNNLVYDITPGSATTTKEGFVFRFYPGDEEQLPDSIIESFEGVGFVPAHRGLCYLVFDDIPITDYGDRIPQLTVEVVFSAVAAPSATLVKMLPDSILAPALPWELGADWRLGYAWAASADGLSRMDINQMAEDRQALWADVTTDGNGLHNLFVGPDGGLYGGVGGASNYAPIARIDPFTMKETARYGVFGSMSGGLPYTTALAGMSIMAPLSGKQDFLLQGGMFGSFGILSIPFMGLTWQGGDGGLYARCGGVIGGLVGTGIAEGWGLRTKVNDGDPPELHKFTILATVSAGLLGAEEKIEVLDTIIPFSADEFDPDATSFTGGAGGLVYDRADNGVMFSVGVHTPAGGKTILAKWIDGQGLAWTTDCPIGWANGTGAGYNASRPDGVAQTVLIGSGLTQLNAATGEVTLLQTSPWASAGAEVFDGQTSSVLTSLGGGQFALIHVGRIAAAPNSIQDIVEAICARAGLADSAVDASQLASDQVTGLLQTQVATANSLIQPLAQGYLFNPVEIDNKLVFVKRGGAIVASVTADEMIRPTATNNGESEPYTETWVQEIELPAIMSVNYLDPAMDYGSNSQQVARNRGPDPTVVSQNQVVLTLPIVMTADEAKQSAQRQLYEAWIARHRFSATLPPTYLYLTAADPVTLVFPAYSIRARLADANIGADYSIEATLMAEAEGQYVSTAKAPVVSTPRQVIARRGPSQAFIFDMPLLRDQDSTPDGLHLYWAGAPASSGSWPGMWMQVSGGTEATLWTDVGAEAAAVSWGVTETALLDPVSTNRIDTTGSVTVTMRVGGDGVTNITNEALLAGFNAMAMIKANGEIEVLQFRDAVSLGGNRFTLSTFLRGRRGSETMAYGHAIGERFVLLASATMQQMTLPAAALGGLRYFRSATIGALPEDADMTSLAPHGRDQMPYAPVHIAASMAGSDIALSWIRRTRIGGTWLPFTGTVPLSEASEAYQVDILSGPGGAVLRTLSVTAPVATYVAADIATDFITAPASLSLRVFQMSAAVGRGFARETTVEVM